MKKWVRVLMLGVIGFVLAACSTYGEGEESADTGAADTSEEGVEASGDGEGYQIAVVPKMTANPWFQRMEEGVNTWNEENGDRGHDVFYIGPAEGDGAQQAQTIEDLIAQDVDAIAVVPFSTESLEPVLQKARDAGIAVIAHEGAGMENIDYDIEAFDNQKYGEHFMEAIVEETGGEGEYIQLLGALTSASHLTWVESAQAYQEEHAPNMNLYGDLIETADSQETAYQRTKEALTANPDIVAIQGSANPDVAGAAQAVEELGLQDQVTIIGTSLVSVAGNYVENGTIDLISFWDPAVAGQAMIELAIKVLDGEEITDGVNLGIEGYESMTLDGNVLVGDAWIDVTEENTDDPDLQF